MVSDRSRIPLVLSHVEHVSPRKLSLSRGPICFATNHARYEMTMIPQLVHKRKLSTNIKGWRSLLVVLAVLPSNSSCTGDRPKLLSPTACTSLPLLGRHRFNLNRCACFSPRTRSTRGNTPRKRTPLTYQVQANVARPDRNSL